MIARSDPLLEAALRYAAIGWPVFPLAAGEKLPAVPKAEGGRGVHDATTDAETLRALWARFPESNVGLALGPGCGLDVVDLDTPRPEKGKTADGRLTLQRLEQLHGPVVTLTALTGSGGQHLFFKHRDGAKNREAAIPGVDVKSAGGYVVVAPSRLKAGGSYEWMFGADPIARLEVAPWPDWLWDECFPPKPEPAPADPSHPTYSVSESTDPYGKKALDELHAELAGARPGTRDGTRNRVAYRMGRLVAEGRIAERDALDALDAACAHNGLTSEEGDEKIHARNEAGLRAGVQAGPAPGAASRRKPSNTRHRAPLEVKPDPEATTDVGNGKRLVRLHGEGIRYSASHGWLVWNGEVWERDRTGEVVRLAKDSAERLVVEGAALHDADARKAAVKFGLQSQKAERVRAAITMAESEPEVVVRPDALDARDYLLVTSNGTLDLKTARLGPHDRRHLVTKAAHAKYDATAECPTWDAFLDRIFGGNAELVGFIQRAVGYSLTGDTGEQCLFLLHGSGANGKTTFLSTIESILGDYSTSADFTTFLAGHGMGPRPDLARLAGARFVLAVEPDDGARFSESIVKQVTGGDVVTARFLYADEFQFKPRMKLWLAANHKPRIRGTDMGIWRRIRLVPFEVTIPEAERDRTLPRKLADEASGILAWAVRGCMDWQREGLKPPPAVLAATEGYRREQDVLAEFLEEHVAQVPTAFAKASDVYATYRTWAERTGEFVMSQTAFGRVMTERGYERTRGSDASRVYRGLHLRIDKQGLTTIR